MRACLGWKLSGSSCGRTYRLCGAVRRVILIFLCAGILVGCGALEVRAQRVSLSESGFLARVPETERQREFYAILPPNKLYGGIKNGRSFYVFKDEKTGVIYVGNEEDYQRYLIRVRRLVSYYETTEEKNKAIWLDNDTQQRWDESLSVRP
jgi:hypothetical protein